MIYEIVITGDTNDGDYVTAINPILENDLERFKPLIEAIKTNSHIENWPTSKYSDSCPEDLYSEFQAPCIDDDQNWISFISEFQEFVPYNIHSITSIVYYEKPINKIKLL